MNKVLEYINNEVCRLDNEIVSIKEEIKEYEIELKTFEARQRLNNKSKSSDDVFSANRNSTENQNYENFQGMVDSLSKKLLFLNSKLDETVKRKIEIEKLVSEVKELEKSNNQVLIAKLNAIINKVDNCRKLITNDPTRVKGELKEIESKLKDCIRDSDEQNTETVNTISVPDDNIVDLLNNLVAEYNSKHRIELELSLPKNSKPVMKIAKDNAVKYLVSIIDNSIESGIVEHAEIKLSFRSDKMYIDYVDEYNKYTFSCNM